MTINLLLVYPLKPGVLKPLLAISTITDLWIFENRFPFFNCFKYYDIFYFHRVNL